VSSGVLSRGPVNRTVAAGTIGDIYVLSPLQQEILSCPEPASCIEQSLLIVENSLETTLLERAWNLQIEQHPILRTVFRRARKAFVQIVLTSGVVAPTVHDLRWMSSEQQKAAIQQTMEEDATLPFDLGNGPLFRLALLHLSETRFGRLLTFHPLIMDPWTAQLVESKVAASYQALQTRATAPSESAPAFKDFILWLRRQDSSEALQYWRLCLEDFAVSTPLPLDPTQMATVGRRMKRLISLPGNLEDALGQLVHQSQISLTTVLQAAWAVLLSRYSGQTDVVFGMTVCGRPPGLQAVERIVGPFVNVLPVRVRLQPEQSLADLLHALQQQVVNANHYSYFPLSEIQATSEIHPPEKLFDTILTTTAIEPDSNSCGSVLLVSGHQDSLSTGAQYKLALDVVHSSGLHVAISFEEGVFESSAIDTLLAAFQRVLENVVANPDERVAELEIGTPTVCGSGDNLSNAAQLRAEVEAARILLGEQAGMSEADSSAAMGEEYVPPRTELEGQIAAVWQEVLGLDRVNVHHDFFDLGGHSLTTIQVRSRLSQRLGMDVPLRTIFENTTVEAQARAIALLEPRPVVTGQAIPRLPDAEYYPVSHAQRRLWFLHRLDPENRFYHTADWVVLDGTLDRPAFEQAVQALGERQAALRTSFTLLADEPVQRISTSVPLPLFFHDLSSLTQKEQEGKLRSLLAEIPNWLSDLEVPPVRALLIKQAEDKHIFVLALHHIISDEWSGQVVWRELMDCYGAACRGQSARLPELGVRYVDFAVWQNDRIETGRLAESERYWLDRLSGELPKLRLPLEDVRAAQPAHDVREETIETSAEVAGQLRRMGQAEEATTFMARLAVFTAFLSRITGQEDILVGSTTAGRDHPDIETLVGLFVNVVALRTSLHGQPPFTEILKRVKQCCVEAYAHQEYPFDLLVQRLAPVRDSESLPILQAFFADVAPMKPQAVEGVWFRAADAGHEAAVGGFAGRLPVNMGMICHEKEDGRLVWHFLFRSDLFAIETTQRLARQFASFLADLVEHPNSPLLELQWAQEVVAEVDKPKLKRVAKRGEFPLAFNQRDMWFQRQIHDEPGLNNLAGQVTLSGPLCHATLREALQIVVDRHEALRTVFFEQDGVPRQRVLPQVEVNFALLDLSARPGRERAETVLERERELVSVPFAFDEGPLFRAGLLRLQEDEHVFIFAFSHLILDGIYMAQLFEEVGAVYSRLLAGETETQSSSEIQYPDFATWQDKRLTLGLLGQHEVYWHKQLQLPIPAMNLPSDRDARLVRSFKLGSVDWQVPDEVFRSFKAFRKRYRTTVFRVVLATFEILLRRVIGERDLLLGVPFSSLPAHLPHLIGFFGHAVPVRVAVDDRQRFSDVLADVNRQVGEAQEHMEYPLCEAIRGLKINRDPNRPLFPVVISQIRKLDLAVGPLRLRMSSRPVYGGVYHLWLTVLEGADGLFLRFYYNRELLEGRPVELLKECMEQLLSQVAVQPETQIGQLEILSSRERIQVLDVYAGTDNSNTETDEGALARIEELARTQPTAVAAICGEKKLHYQDLNQAANRLAHWLREQGVRREDRVGVFGTRGLGMLTTLLGILKAGAAFVPLDPEQPDARVNSILRQADVQVLACDAGTVIRSQEFAARALAPLKVVCWDTLPAELRVPNPMTWAGRSDSNIAHINGPRDLAYVCHTSGSTGTPKGAMVEHRGMLNHLLAKIDFLGLDRNSVVAQNASHCFDISIWQFFAVLLAGGRLVIYPQETLFQPLSLLAVAEHDGVTVLETVPSLLEMMLNELPATVRLPRLRHLISNAELLPVPLCHRWMERFPHILLVNTYGATECSDDTTHHVVRDGPGTLPRVPVGRSIPGARHYVLDQELRTLPAGCVGQIAIGGDAVGRGYLGNAVATAQTFVPDPFRGDGHRLYLSGDMGRWNSAGELEFLGRTDTQVKLHGQRVELGEIEAALARHPGIRQVAVVVQVESQSQRVIAYWVGEVGVDTSKLRAYSQRELPSYMVPNAFVRLTAMPLTANGKINRQALPLPGISEFVEFVPPRDEVEFAVAKLWQEELGITDVGVFDNFFERGGHSLMAVRLISRLQVQFAVKLPLRTVFDHQTIDSLSRAIRDCTRNGTPSISHAGRLVQLQRGDSSCRPLFLVHPHGGTVFCYQALAAALGSELPVFGIQCRGLEEGEQPFTSIEEMASDYVKGMRVVQPEGPYRVAGWSLGGTVAFEMARQLEGDGLKVDFLGIFDSAIPSTTGTNLEFLVPVSADLKDFNSDMSVATFARWFFRADEQQFAGLSDQQSVDALREMAGHAGMLPPDVSPIMLKRFIAVAIHSGIALFQYRPAGPVQTDVVLFRAEQSMVGDPRWWSPWTTGALRTIPVAGSHYNMVFPPAVHVLATALKEQIGALADASGVER
jgi:amino acid adenylation domain-containing protein